MKKILRFFFGYEHPVNLYEQCPAFAWLIFILFVMYVIWGCLVIF